MLVKNGTMRAHRKHNGAIVGSCRDGGIKVAEESACGEQKGSWVKI